GQGGELRDGVAAGEGGGDIDVVALGGPGGQGGDLAADRVVQVEHGAELHQDRLAAAVEVGHLEQQLRAAGDGDDPLGQPVAHALEYLGHSRRLVLPFGGVACPAQR